MPTCNRRCPSSQHESLVTKRATSRFCRPRHTLQWIWAGKTATRNTPQTSEISEKLAKRYKKRWIWEKMVQVADWLTHYLTQFNGERPDMVSMFWDVRITVFCLLYIWKTLFFSGELLWWQPCSCLQNTLKDLRAEVQRFSKVNHLVWSTWSVIQVNDSHSILQNIKHEVRILLILQAVSSSIDYDYFEYARIRLGEYLKLKTEQ